MCQMGHGHGHGHGGGLGHHHGHGCCTFGGGHHHYPCCCGGMHLGMGWRRYFTKADEIACLESYREQLQKELAGVEARMKELYEQQ